MKSTKSISYNTRMQKNKSLLLITMLVVVSCNFPIFRKTISPNQVSTQVAISQTATWESQAQIPSPSLPSPTLLVTPSKTMEPLSTITPEPSITVTESDFSSQLGSPSYSNPMNSGSAFGLDAAGYDDGFIRIVMSDGSMVLTSYPTTGWRGWRLTDKNLSNFYMEGTFITQTCSGKDQYGLVFRSLDYSNGEGYYFGVTCDGKYSLVLSDGNRYRTLIDWTSSEKIVSGSNQTNRLGVLADGPSIDLFINGEKVNNTNDSAYLAATKIGAFILALNTAGFTVHLDQLNLWAR
jgi:hypothetical protein